MQEQMAESQANSLWSQKGGPSLGVAMTTRCTYPLQLLTHCVAIVTKIFYTIEEFCTTMFLHFEPAHASETKGRTDGAHISFNPTTVSISCYEQPLMQADLTRVDSEGPYSCFMANYPREFLISLRALTYMWLNGISKQCWMIQPAALSIQEGGEEAIDPHQVVYTAAFCHAGKTAGR
ncbi:hypothetical protein CEXT_410341 [Caerostris extrusa]|uniref:Uncharacterized protein n=1 Tax=Caerostris extrusa TaxID=172846 RepID=A0AAV4UMG6_CAEEX|nr:hypothetical protein CEXT_410341 [Caerostris extrusa]